MTQTHELQLKINAAAAKSGADQFTAAIKSIKLAVESLGRSSDGVFQTLRKDLNAPKGKGLEAAAKKTDDAMTRLATSVQNSMTLATSQTARLKNQFDQLGNATGIRKAEEALARFQVRAKSVSTITGLASAKADYKATITGLQSEAKAQAEVAKAEAQRAASLDALKKRHDSIFAVSKRYEKSLEEITSLERLGALSAEKATAARTRAANQLNDGAVATGKYGQALRVNQYQVTNFTGSIADMTTMARKAAGRFNLRNVSMQLSQVAQQGSVTGNYVQALMIQLPDLALGFGPVGIAAGAVAGVLGSTLVGALSSSDREAERLKNQVKALSTELDSLEANSQAGAAQIQSYLQSTFGGAASDVQALIDDLQRVQFTVISNKMQREIEKSTGILNKLGGAFEVFWGDFANPGNTDPSYLQSMNDLIAKSRISYTEFTNLESAIKDVFTARDVSEFVRRLAEARQIASDIGGPVGGSISVALLKAGKDSGILNRMLAEAASAANDTDKGLADATISASDLAQIDIAGAISGAASYAMNLADSMGSALRIALNLKQMRDSGYAGRGGDPRPNMPPPKTPPKNLPRPRLDGGFTSDPLAETTARLKEQNLALEALRNGQYSTTEAAQLFAEQVLKSGGSLDAETASTLANIDALAQRNSELQKTPTDLSADLRTGTQNALEGAIREGLTGNKASIQNFAKAIQGNVASALAKAISQKLMKGLGLDRLFNVGAAASGQTIATSMVAAGNIVATDIATAIRTGNATSSPTGGGGGGFFGFVKGLFGFDEGVANTSSPAAWQRVPAFAEGTANTSGGGMPAILHPNEAVVPLSRGRKIPVDIGKGKGGGDVVFNGGITSNVTVQTAEGETDAEQARNIAKAVEESITGLVETKLAESLAYGGIANPRGGM